MQPRQKMGKLAKMAGMHSSVNRARSVFVLNGEISPCKFRHAPGSFSRDKMVRRTVDHVVAAIQRKLSDASEFCTNYTKRFLRVVNSKSCIVRGDARNLKIF